MGLIKEACYLFLRQMAEFLMRYGNDQCIQILNRLSACKLHAIQPFRFLCIRRLIHNHRLDAVFPQFLYNIYHLGVSGIRTVLLEGEAQNAHARATDDPAALDETLDDAFRQEGMFS